MGIAKGNLIIIKRSKVVWEHRFEEPIVLKEEYLALHTSKHIFAD